MSTHDDLDHFYRAIERTMAFEGGWSDDPDDRGGRTKYGITEGTWQTFRNRGLWKGAILPTDVANITREHAIHVYMHLYWDAIHLSELQSGIVSARVFDCAVNSGTGRAVKLLQQAHNAIVPDGWGELKTDGIMGAITIRAINRLSEKYEQALLGAFNAMRFNYYSTIIQNNQSQRKFVRGWSARCT
jgi:lysozyme family protein